MAYKGKFCRAGHFGRPDGGDDGSPIQAKGFMMDAIGTVLYACYPILTIVLIVLVSTRPVFRGRFFFLGYLIISLINTLVWTVVPLLPRFGIFSDGSFYRYLQIPSVLLSLGGFCLLIPFVLAVGSSDGSFPQADAQREPSRIP